MALYVGEYYEIVLGNGYTQDNNFATPVLLYTVVNKETGVTEYESRSLPNTIYWMRGLDVALREALEKISTGDFPEPVEYVDAD